MCETLPRQVRRIAEIINSGIQPLQNLATLKKVAEVTGEDSKKAGDWAQYFIIKGFRGLLPLFGIPFIEYAVRTLSNLLMRVRLIYCMIQCAALLLLGKDGLAELLLDPLVIDGMMNITKVAQVESPSLGL